MLHTFKPELLKFISPAMQQSSASSQLSFYHSYSSSSIIDANRNFTVDLHYIRQVSMMSSNKFLQSLIAKFKFTFQFRLLSVTLLIWREGRQSPNNIH